jgi:hypothetical protein
VGSPTVSPSFQFGAGGGQPVSGGEPVFSLGSTNNNANAGVGGRKIIQARRRSKR